MEKNPSMVAHDCNPNTLLGVQSLPRLHAEILFLKPVKRIREFLLWNEETWAWKEDTGLPKMQDVKMKDRDDDETIRVDARENQAGWGGGWGDPSPGQGIQQEFLEYWYRF